MKITAAGEIDPDYAGFLGNVKPLCGDLNITFVNTEEPGAALIQENYYSILSAMWQDTQIDDVVNCLVDRYGNTHDQDPVCSDIINSTFIDGVMQDYHNQYVAAMIAGIGQQRSTGLFNLPDELLRRGWAGAAIWYNKIAEMNGAMADATNNLPEVTRLPFLIEKVIAENTKQNANVMSDQKLSLILSDENGVNNLVSFNDPRDYDRFVVMAVTYDSWVHHKEASGLTGYKESGNVVIRFINAMLGTSGIFEMRDNTNVHPLAQLSALGKV